MEIPTREEGFCMSAVMMFSLLLGAVSPAGDFLLASPAETATIVVPASEPPCVRLAAEDLAADVEKITGRKPQIVNQAAQRSPCTVLVTTASIAESAKLLDPIAPGLRGQLQGKWEAYRVQDVVIAGQPRTLVIAGSDERGTMFGIYAFLEKYLGVDPMYYWTDRSPEKRSELRWSKIRLESDEPTFRYRGWFINDEDLITGWKRNSAVRAIEYKFYQRVLSPEVAERIYEAMLRLQYNLVIPSSFIDLGNPDEARLVDLAVRRGLFVSMHHQEPLGVTGLYTFPNYWRAKGEDVPFSFVTHRAKFEEIWREYARRWSRYGDHVVWQLGLRGKGDRALWETDSKAPASNADRGRLISDAIARQWDIVRSVDRRPNPPATMTLWMEGSKLCRQGCLKFPPDMAVVFADCCPGWKMQADFFETQREPGRPYGIYYHPALWNVGPHFCQAVSPQKMHEIFKLAVDRGDTYYALLNVANVREFPLNVAAGSQLLRDFRGFDPDAFLARWCKDRFSPMAEAAERTYRAYFDTYLYPEGAMGRHRLDGETMVTGQKRLGELVAMIESRTQPVPDRSNKTRQVLRKTRGQRQALERSTQEVDQVLAGLKGESRAFFQTNLVVQQRIMLSLVGWLESVLSADLAFCEDRRGEIATHARAAETHLRNLRAAQSLGSQGKWSGWYDGDDLMDVTKAENDTRKLLSLVAPPAPKGP
jgi:hypothetical protein